MPNEQAMKVEVGAAGPRQACVAHFSIMNQKAIRTLLGRKWGEIVPLLEVQIGKLLRSEMPDDHLVFRKQELNYYLVCFDYDFAEATCFLERLSASIYARTFGEDPALDGLQIALSAYASGSLDVSDPAALKAALFSQDDEEGWSRIIDKSNAASFQLEQVDNKLVRQIIGMRSACDHLISLLHPIPETDAELALHSAALERVSSVSRSLHWSIARLLQGDAAAGPEPEELDDQIEDAVPSAAVEKNTKHQPPEKPIPAVAVSASSIKEAALAKDLTDIIGENAEFAYFPIWNVEQQAVNSYRCGVVRHLPTGGVELNTGSETDIAAYKIDGLAQRKLALDLREGGLDQDESTFVLPLHINTLQSREHFPKIELALKSLTLLERKKMKIEIIGATENTLLKTVQKAIGEIKDYCSAIGYRVVTGKAISENLRKIGVTHAGFHLADLRVAGKNPANEIEALGKMCEKRGLASFVMGVDNVADASISIGAGINFIGGQAVGNALDMPWGTLPFQVESLYSRVLST